MNSATLCTPLCFTVHGNPIAKQSFKVVREGNKVRGYQPARVHAWHDLVCAAAKEVWQNVEPLDEYLRVHIDFYLPTKRRVDLDNLSKNTLDAITHAGVWQDDKLIVDLHVLKHFVTRNAGRAVITIDVTSNESCEAYIDD